MKKLKRIIYIFLVMVVVISVSCKSMNNFIELKNWFESSGVRNNIITINYQDNNVVCKFSCKYGTVFASGYDVPIEEVKATVNQEVSWVHWTRDFHEKVYNDYVSILLLKESKVIGYAVLEVFLKENNVDYQANILKQKLLIMPISEDDAKQIIAKIIDEKGDNH